MSFMLVIMAVIILLCYSIYFVKIIQGSARGLELEVLKTLAEWIIRQGVSSKTYIWIMFFLTLLVEIVYFFLTFYLILNPVIRVLTILFIAFEVFHLAATATNLNRFFTGRYLLRQVFNWRIERTSAVLFFTHALLVLFVLVYG